MLTTAGRPTMIAVSSAGSQFSIIGASVVFRDSDFWDSVFPRFLR